MTLKEAYGLAIVAALLVVVQGMDATDQARMEAAQKAQAHALAQRLREQGLLDQANRMLYPLAQTQTASAKPAANANN